MSAKNPLERYFRANQGRLIHKWLHSSTSTTGTSPDSGASR